jgi:predicted DNA-binding transcriptional regulator AlpA
MRVWEWPRWLSRDLVADYLSIRVPEIPKLVKAGRLPQPTYHLGPRTPRWDRDAIDDMFGVSERAKKAADLESAAQRSLADILNGGRRGARKPPPSIFDENGRRRQPKG